jgi:hypothetical protein
MKNIDRSRQWARIAAIAVLALFGCIAVFAQDDDPPPQAGRLSALTGTVSIQPAGSQDWGQAYANLPMGPGDRIVTDQDGRAEIEVERTYIRIGPNTDVTLVDISDSALTFGVAQGSVVARSQGLWPNQSLYVQTPSGTVTVNQPAGVRIDVMPSDQTAVFSDRWGSAYISGAGDFSQQIGEGQAIELVGTNPVSSQWLAPIGGDDLDRFNDQRNALIEHASSWQYISPAIPGGQDLDANGEWAAASDYGPVWYPRVDAGWAPYRNGHWANRDPWGWIWVEDESWGYAPFHFGRWVTINGRWGWVPGPREARPVWSPALVVFVGGQPGMSAWIPLGPGEPFRPWYRCSPRYIDAVNISNIRPSARVVVQRTYVNVTNVNITYVNRTAGVTVVRQDDFAAGHAVARAAVRVDPAQFSAHVNVVIAPQQVQARRMSIVSAPAARPVRVAAERPVMINAKGQTIAAQAHAQPMATPVKAVAAPKPLAGRTVVAPPPNAKPQAHQPEAARPGNEPAPAAHPAQPSQPPATRPAPEPKMNQQPAQTPKPQQPAQTPKPQQPAQTQPKPNQMPAPAPKPQGPAQAKPGSPPPAQPGQAQPKPGQTPQTKQQQEQEKQKEKDKKQPPPPPPSA